MNVFLETKDLVLTPVTIQHCNDRYLSWFYDKEVQQHLVTGTTPITKEDLVNFLQNQPQQRIFLAIHLKSNKEHIGNIKLDGIDQMHGLAEYGILMGEKKEWGKGYAKQASAAIITYAFVSLNLRKITLGVVATNHAAIHLYEKLGFAQEALYKEHWYKDGAYHDIVRMGLLKKLWKPIS